MPAWMPKQLQQQGLAQEELELLGGGPFPLWLHPLGPGSCSGPTAAEPGLAPTIASALGILVQKRLCVATAASDMVLRLCLEQVQNAGSCKLLS